MKTINNAVDTVPARIVIIGTSKMRLSERFNKLQKAPPPAPQPQKVSVRKVSESFNGGGGISVGQVVTRPRVVDERDLHARPANRSQNNRSFLHDDYMDNDLYGVGLRSEQLHYQPAVPPPVVRRMPLHMSGMRTTSIYELPEEVEPQEYYDPDPLKLSLDQYDHYSRYRTARRRSIHARITDTARGRFMHHRMHSLYEDLDDDGGAGDEFYNADDLPRAKFNNSRRTIYERISYRPTRLSDLEFLRRPLQRNAVMFKRPFYGRDGGGSRFGYGAGVAGSAWGRRRLGPFGRRGGGRWGDKRFKKSVAELDRELDEYMRSAKHPRVKPSTSTSTAKGNDNE